MAAALGVSRNAVQTWQRRYRAGGLAAVRSRRRGGAGKPCFLTPAQQAELAAEVRDWVEARFGVSYRVGSLYTLLPRLGIRLKAPRPRHTKADPQAQTAWKKGGSGPG